MQKMFEFFLKACSNNIQHDSLMSLLPSNSGVISLLKLQTDKGMHLEKLKGVANDFFFTSTESLNSLHRQARGPQAARGNKLQVADIFPFSVENTWLHLILTLLNS